MRQFTVAKFQLPATVATRCSRLAPAQFEQRMHVYADKTVVTASGGGGVQDYSIPLTIER